MTEELVYETLLRGVQHQAPDSMRPSREELEEFVETRLAAHAAHLKPGDDIYRPYILAHVEGYLRNHTQKQLAQEVGTSPSAISQWIHNDYRGNPDVMNAKLKAWADRQKIGGFVARHESSEIWVETPTSKQIFDAITYSRSNHTIALIYGGAGVGKTTAIHEYQSSYPDVWVWTASPAQAAMLEALRQVRGAMCQYTTGYQRQHIVRDILECMNQKKGVLVVDEAQHLGLEVLEQLRSLFDASHSSLVFCGNQKIVARMGGGGKAEFAQLTSRVGRRVRLDMPKPEDVAAILHAWEIEGAKELEFARQVASLHGGLRVLGNVLREAALLVDGPGKPIDLKTMRMARESLGELA